MKLNLLLLVITLINQLISESVDCNTQCKDQGFTCLAKCYINKISNSFSGYSNPSKSNSTLSSNSNNNNTNLSNGFDSFVSSLEKQGSAIQTGVSVNGSNVGLQGSSAEPYVLIASANNFVINCAFVTLLTTGFGAIF